MPSEVTYQVLGFFTVPMALTRRAACLRIRLAMNSPALLPPSLPWLSGTKTIRSIRPKKSSSSTYFLAMLIYANCSVKNLRIRETLTLSAVDLASWTPFGHQVPVPPDGFQDIAQRGVDALQGFDHRAGAVLVDPLVDPAEDLLLGQVGRGDPERLLAQPEGPLQGLLFQGRVLLAEKRSAALTGAVTLDQVSRLGDAPPAEIVDHLAGDAEEEVLVGVAKKVQGDPPAFLDLDGAPPLLAHLLIHRPQPLMENEVPQPLGDRLDELDLAGQERPAVRRLGGLSVGDGDAADHRVMNADLGALDVRRVFVVGGREDVGTMDDPRLAEFGELPARGYDGDHAPEHVLRGKAEIAQDLFDLVETAQLLGALVERREESRLRLGRFAVTHGRRLSFCRGGDGPAGTATSKPSRGPGRRRPPGSPRSRRPRRA